MSQPEKLWKKPRAAHGPIQCDASPVPATRAALARMAMGIADSAIAIRAGVRWSAK